jgi:hypothetical protein
MMQKILKIRKFVLLLAMQVCAIAPMLAAGNSTDFLRSTGKIYSVVVVIIVIFAGLAIFLFRLDHKLTKLENQIRDEQ